MDAFANLMLGFAAAFTLKHLLMCFLGVLMGQMVGVLPGIGPSAAIALLLPLTFGADPTAAIILFAGIYYGAQYGGTLTSVLVSVPGESSTVMTSIDGYQMAVQGRAGPALGIAAIGSFVAGTLGTVGLMLLAPALATAALAFGPPEYFALVVLGLTALAAVGSSVMKGLATGVAGLLLGTVGIDPQNGVARFDFGQLWLLDGVEFIVLTVALFGVGEVVASCGLGAFRPVAEVKNALPTRADLKASRLPILRGTGIGFLVGVLPAAGATIASFVAYIVEKKLARDPSRFGHGAIEGVAAPEASNNAAAAGAMVPMLSLGVPGSGTTAIILGAFIMFGIRPGPELFTNNADLVWAVIASMYIGNVILLLMNLPLAGLFARLLKVPYRWLYPPILALCVTGVYSQANSVEDCWLLVGFGALGWLMKRYDWPAAPMILGLVLGPLFETALRQSLTLSHGSGVIFFTRPISAVLLAAATIAVLVPLLMQMRAPRVAPSP
ncbi:MAG TPA: tripartite tricarboxylate transporter permease [Hyphomicrobiaceae bacterium]|nr:tripartite tricarboxylate transporter permease [Hyphomicrobiaceae bacterium]